MRGMSTKASSLIVQRSAERYHGDHGWLSTYHSFSFADYFDPNNSNWGALRVFNEDRVLAGKGFGTHPHRDMEIITYVIDGELEHRDSMGNHGVVKPGGIQYLSAGTGITHSEFNHSKDTDVHFVQMWVLPRSPGLKPNYGQRQFERPDRLNTWLTVASGQSGVIAPVAILQDASLHIARLEDGEVTYRYGEGRFGFVFVATGEVEINGEKLTAGDSARVHGIGELTLEGGGEVVLWDVPGVTA